MPSLTGRTIQPKPQKPERGTAAAKAHMEKVSRLCCCVCGARPVEVHHTISGRFGSRKRSDFDTIPLCAETHHRHGPESIHGNRAEFERLYGPDTGFLPLVKEMLERMT